MVILRSTHNNGQFLYVDSQLLDIEMQKVLAKAQQCMEQFVDKFEKIEVGINSIFDKTLAE